MVIKSPHGLHSLRAGPMHGRTDCYFTVILSRPGKAKSVRAGWTYLLPGYSCICAWSLLQHPSDSNGGSSKPNVCRCAITTHGCCYEPIVDLSFSTPLRSHLFVVTFIWLPAVSCSGYCPFPASKQHHNFPPP